MAPARARTLKEQIEDLQDPTPKGALPIKSRQVLSLTSSDFDPEDDSVHGSDSDQQLSDSEVKEADDNAARSHYTETGKSALRSQKTAPLGPRYTGSRVARKELDDDDDDEHDPFAVGPEDESDSDDSQINAEDAASLSTIDSDDNDDADDGTSSSPTEVDSDDQVDDTTTTKDDLQQEMQQLMAQEQKSVATTLSRAAKDDAEKGKAVKTQRATFDALLNARIKLQKALASSNTLTALTASPVDKGHTLPDKDALLAAETAAFKLWQTVTDLRDTLHAPQPGTKRSHSQFSLDTSTESLYAHMQTQEQDARPNRTAILDKWASRTRSATTLAARSDRLNQTAQRGLCAVLEQQLSTPDKLIARTRVPRACAPLQLAAQQTSATLNSSANSSAHIYDDTDFYGVLLQSLLEQRASDTTNNPVSISQITANYSKNSTNGIEALSGHQMRREAKVRRVVDNKASKGRRIKYSVHEKLQNLMAPEDRCEWDSGRVDELFAGLFGVRRDLAEASDDESQAGQDVSDVDAIQDDEVQRERLRLF